MTVRFLVPVILLAMASVSHAQVDPTRVLGVQGSVMTSGGTPANGDFDMEIRLFGAETGGAPLYAQTVPGVSVVAGLFDVELGPVPEGVVEGGVLWLETVVAGEPLPRRPMRPVATALLARRALVALDLSCSGCVTSAHVNFPWAAAASKGGAALDLDCSGCVSSTDLAGGAVATGHLQDGAVTTAKVGFAYAGAVTAGGPAVDVACTGCVGSSDLASALATGQLSAAGAVYACTSGAPGCAVFVRDAALADHGDGWLNAQAASGLRIRSPNNDAWRPLQLGGGTSYGTFTVSGGDLAVSGAASVGQLTAAGALIGPGGAGLLVNDGSGTTPHAAALLEVRSVTRGLLPPRVTTAQRNSIAGPTAGLLVYNTTTDTLQTYGAGGWKDVGPTTSTSLLTAGPTSVASGQSLVLTHGLGTLDVLVSAWVQAADGKWDAITGSDTAGSELMNVASAAKGGTCIGQSSAYQGAGINGSYGCSNAVDGAYNDGATDAWATNGQGVGSWLTIKLDKNYQLRKIGYKQRGCSCEWNKDIRLNFSDGSIQTVTLANSQGTNLYDLAPVVTNQVTITVLSVWSTVNNGANEIELWGNDPPKDLRVRKTINTVEIENQSGSAANLHLVVGR
ncbi:MAG: hypothetical protein AMXMBFR64_08160 [Myxococcales bacterium]